jgi:dUTP pyrophosphatase
MALRFKKLSDSAIIPIKAKEGDAGYDLSANEDIILPFGGYCLVKTGLSMELPIGYVGQICPRSGLALKEGITVLNAPGIIDAGYRGEIGVILTNNMVNRPYIIKKGERIAQLVILKLAELPIMVVEELATSERGNGGFGSTGIRYKPTNIETKNDNYCPENK